MIAICDPRSEPGVPVDEYELGLDPAGTGLVIGLVSNGFPDATNLLEELGHSLIPRLARPQVRLFERRDSSVVMPDSMLSEVVDQCDAVVTAMGHCGSCTSSTVRDAVMIARQGVPVVALVTEKFWESAGFVARSVGMPKVPRVCLPYPVAGSGRERIANIALARASAVLTALEGPRA